MSDQKTDEIQSEDNTNENNQIIEKQPEDIFAKMLNILIVAIVTILLSYLFIPSIRNDYFEIFLNVIMVISVYIVYELYF